MWCHNPTCRGQLAANIDHWFKKLGVKGIGGKTIEKLVNEETDSFNNAMVESISDMYGLRHYTSELSDKFGPKAFSNMADAVESVKEVTLAKFIESLGLGKVGRMASDITDIAPTIEDIDKLKIRDIIAIEGFAEIKETGFVQDWKAMREEIGNILEHVSIKGDVKASDNLVGKSFALLVLLVVLPEKRWSRWL